MTQVALGYVALSISIITNLGLMPMYLRYIDGRLYGLWLASGGVVAWLGLLDLGIAGVMGQRIAAAYGRRDHRDIGLYYFNGQLFQIILMAVLVTVSAFVAWTLPHLLGARLNEERTLEGAVFLAGVSTAFTFLNNGQQNTAGALQRPLVPMLSAIAGRILTVAVTIMLLLEGHGLMALPIGLLVGAVFTFFLNLFYVRRLVRRLGGLSEWNSHVFGDILRLSPALFAAKGGNALVGQIEPTLIALMIAPEAAVVFTLTKRAADTIQNIIDRVTGSVTAGFAHLYAEGDIERAGEVANTVSSICLGLSVVCLAAYVALNHSFIRLWVGDGYFAGNAVTFLVALSAGSEVFGNLFSMMLGAMGDIAGPCVATLVEAIVRLLLMALLLYWFGLTGLPLATIVSGGGLMFWFLQRMRLRPGHETYVRTSGLERLLPLIIAVGAFGVGEFLHVDRWTTFAFALATVVGVAAVIVSITKPDLRARLVAIASGK